MQAIMNDIIILKLIDLTKILLISLKLSSVANFAKFGNIATAYVVKKTDTGNKYIFSAYDNMATEPSTKNEANNLSIIGFININPFAIIIKIINLYLIKFFVSCLKKDFIFNSVYFKSFKIQSILNVLAKIIEKANKYP